MNQKGFPFDFEKMFDEAFKFAETFRGSFDPEKMKEAAERMRDAAGQASDYYPAYQYPPVNFYLTPDKKLVLEMALAGFEEKDLSVQYRGEYLIFSASAPRREEESGVQYFKRRLKIRDVEEQRYYVPTERFDQERTDARFKDGLLRIVVPPRTAPTQEPGIKVTIRVGEEPR